MTPGSSLPSPARPTERQLRWLALALLFTAAIIISVIASGASDPQPQGELSDSLIPGPLAVGAEEAITRWTTVSIPTDSASTFRLTAAYTDGEIDSGYGLALGNPERTLIVALSPLGYLAIWEQDEQGVEQETILPWQTWPHVRGGTIPNEIWVDILPDGDQATIAVRINREHLWQGTRLLPAPDAGLWAGSFGEVAAFNYQQLERFVAAPGTTSP